MGKRNNSIIISGIIVAFILGSFSSVTLVEGSPASDAALIAALNGIRDAIFGITPTQTVTVESATPDIILQSIEGPQGIQGIPGTLSESAVYNVQGIRFVNAPLDTVLMSQTVVLSVPSSVIVQVDAIALNRGASDQLFWYDLEVNGIQVAETLSSAAGVQEWNQAGLNWAGDLGVGSHTIEVKLVLAFTGNICSGKDCNLSILVVG